MCLQEEDEPKALENERKRTSMQGNNILGVTKRPKLVPTQRSEGGFYDDGTGPAGRLGGGQEAQTKTTVENRPRNVG